MSKDVFTPSADLQSDIDYLERERWQFATREPVDRKGLEKEFLIAWGILVLLFILLFITEWLVLLVPILALFAYFFFVYDKKEIRQDKITAEFLDEYRYFYKEKIITPLLESVGQDLVYTENGSITDKHNELPSSDIVSTEDLVELTIDGINVDFGEMIFEVRDEETHKKIQIKQFACVATFNKNFKSETSVMCGNANMGKILENFLPKKIRSALKTSMILPNKHIMLDNPSFNQHFTVFTDDEIEARYLLTHTLMEKMLAFHQFFPFMSYNFINNKIIFQTRSDLVATETVNHALNVRKTSYYELFDYTLDDEIYTQTERHYELIHGVIEMIKLLELNRIIWK